MKAREVDTERYIEIRSLWEDGSADDEWDSWGPGDINWLFYYIEKLRNNNLSLLLDKDELRRKDEVNA